MQPPSRTQATQRIAHTLQPAGRHPDCFIKMMAQDFDAKLRKRSYKPEDEVNRNLTISEALNKIDQNYKRVVNQNLWNEKARLSPKFKHYHYAQHTFRGRQVQPLEKIERQAQEKDQRNQTKRLMESKRGSHSRHDARVLERQILQMRSDQLNDENSISQMQAFQDQEPAIVDELLLKNRWSRAQKNPERCLKDQMVDPISYWQQLKNLPQKMVDQIVNPTILKMDKRSCDHILNRMYADMQENERKQQIQQLERAKLRSKLRDNHNKSLDLEKQVGVRLGSTGSDKRDKAQLSSIENAESEIGLTKEVVVDCGAEISKIENQASYLNSQMQAEQDLLSQINTHEASLASHDNQLRLKFPQRATQTTRVPLQNILSQPRAVYHGKDFFQRQEFRGLLLADYQEACGPKAIEKVQNLNDTTIGQFQQLKSFRNALEKRDNVDRFYKSFQTSAQSKQQQRAKTTFATTTRQLKRQNEQDQLSSHVKFFDSNDVVTRPATVFATENTTLDDLIRNNNQRKNCRTTQAGQRRTTDDDMSSFSREVADFESRNSAAISTRAACKYPHVALVDAVQQTQMLSSRGN